MTYEEYLRTWSALHGGYDPRQAGRAVRGWVRTAYTIGSWLGGHRVRPGTVTSFGLLLCLLVPAAVPLGNGGLLLGALLVLLAALTDGLDGAVAVITGRVSRLGYVYDSVADRLGEAAWLTAFWLAGVPGWLAAAAGGVAWLHEYLRARAASAPAPAPASAPAPAPAPVSAPPVTPGAGGVTPDIGVVTVGERPTRVSLAISGLLIAALAGFIRTQWTSPVLTVAAAVWLALSVIGFGQLAVVLRRTLD